MKSKIILGLIIFLILSQLIRIDKTNPPLVQNLDYIEITKPSPEISMLLKNACYDCHSNETVYPWYTNVAPISWWIKNHIKGARSKLNFSTWGSYKENKKGHLVDECHDFVEKKWMPIKSYTLMHGNAKLSETQRKALLDWFKKS